jgi:hypothetical protein
METGIINYFSENLNFSLLIQGAFFTLCLSFVLFYLAKKTEQCIKDINDKDTDAELVHRIAIIITDTHVVPDVPKGIRNCVYSPFFERLHVAVAQCLSPEKIDCQGYAGAFFPYLSFSTHNTVRRTAIYYWFRMPFGTSGTTKAMVFLNGLAKELMPEQQQRVSPRAC